MSPRPPAVLESSAGRESRPDAALNPFVRWGDALAYSSFLPAAIAAALSLAASRALRAPAELHWALLASAGTFIIYSLDRLRDVERDRATSPIRTTFVVRHRRGLVLAVGLVAIVFGVALLWTGTSVSALCAAIGGVGVFHRRLKRFPALKAAYVSIAWVAACVGMPWIAVGGGAAGVWAVAILLPTLAANVLASNVLDGETPVHSLALQGFGSNLFMARVAIGIAIAIAIIAPVASRNLAWIPFFEGLAIAAFRPTERYGHIVVDGALLVGAVATSLALA